MKINIEVTPQETLDALLEHIEDTEDTGLLYEILAWGIKELDNYGRDCPNKDIQKGYKLLDIWSKLEAHKERINTNTTGEK